MTSKEVRFPAKVLNADVGKGEQAAVEVEIHAENRFFGPEQGVIVTAHDESGSQGGVVDGPDFHEQGIPLEPVPDIPNLGR